MNKRSNLIRSRSGGGFSTWRCSSQCSLEQVPLLCAFAKVDFFGPDAGTIFRSAKFKPIRAFLRRSFCQPRTQFGNRAFRRLSLELACSVCRDRFASICGGFFPPCFNAAFLEQFGQHLLLIRRQSFGVSQNLIKSENSHKIKAITRLTCRIHIQMSIRHKFSIFHFIRLILPLLESSQRLLVHELLHDQFAFGDWTRDFGVDEIVVETDPCGVLARVGVIDFPHSRPVNRRKAHRTRFATRVQFAIVEMKSFQSPAGFADGHDFCVRGRVVGGSDLVPALADDFALAHDDRAERPALVAPHHLKGDADGFAHEGAFHANSVAGFSLAESARPPSKIFSNLPPLHLRSRYNVAKTKSGAAPPCPHATSEPRRTLSTIHAGSER